MHNFSFLFEGSYDFTFFLKSTETSKCISFFENISRNDMQLLWNVVRSFYVMRGHMACNSLKLC